MSGGKDEEGSGSFADLIGEATPLGKGVKRHVSPQKSRAVSKRRTGNESTEGPEAGFRRPDPEQRRLAGRSGVSDRQLRDLARGEPAPEERIDLHGLRVAGTDRTLARRLASAQQRGLRCVVVIHGRGRNSGTGEAVLRDQMPDWLTQAPAGRFVLAFAPAPPALGGSGATLVLLRKKG